MERDPQQDLLDAAMEARDRAYAPYSGFRVGAALRYGTGDIVSGCNVENASYGGTICAERSAICRLVSRAGKQPVMEVLVVTDAHPASPPCGLCLQVLAEFCKPDTPVHLANLDGIERTVRLNELLPLSFTEVPNPPSGG